MGSKQKKQLARARMRAKHAEFARANLQRRLRKLESRPVPVVYAIEKSVAGSPSLAYTFYMSLYDLQHMSSMDRRMRMEYYVDKAFAELNEKYPPAHEWNWTNPNGKQAAKGGEKHE